MFQSDEDFSMSVSTLSIPQLQHVTQKLRIFCLRRKVDFIRAIVNDFCYERCNYIVIHLSFEIKKKNYGAGDRCCAPLRCLRNSFQGYRFCGDKNHTFVARNKHSSQTHLTEVKLDYMRRHVSTHIDKLEII